METLSNIILKKMSIENLFQIYSNTELVSIEEEVERRLANYDVNVINFLYDHQYSNWLNSGFIRNGIQKALEVVPWRIGVIYNYQDQSYRFDNLFVTLGEQNYKTSRGQKFIPTWLNSSKTKLVLREVVSTNSKTINNSLVTSDPFLDSQIRNILINNNTANITVCTFIPSNQSYDQTLPGGEFKTMYPCMISSENFNHNLVNLPLAPINVLSYNVNIMKSQEFEKLINLFYINSIK